MCQSQPPGKNALHLFARMNIDEFEQLDDTALEK